MIRTIFQLAVSSGVLLAAFASAQPAVESWDQWQNSLAPEGDRGASICLAREGQARYRIVIPAQPTTMEQKAAGDLATWLHDMTGGTFAVVSDTEAPQAREIAVGDTNRLPKALETPDLRRHGYQIAQDGERLLVLGGTRRGILNGVYALLEEDLGCRWYDNRSGVRMPQRATLELAPVSRVSVPQLLARDPWYFLGWDRDYAVANRITPIAATRHHKNAREIPGEWGGGMRYFPADLWVHSYHWLVPPKEYWDDHPEYFMLDGKGKRIGRQLCETNRDVVKIIADKILGVLDAHPDIQLISVSKNDGGGTCLCDGCRTLNEAEGSDAASLLALVNRVADKVGKKYPDVIITTLAYLETIRPPKTVKPHKNVGIRVCNDKVSWPKPFTPAETDPDYVAMVERWSKVCDRIYAWDYGINFSHQIAPCPNMYAIAENIRFFVRNNAQGYMAQSNYESGCAEREWMRCWVISKLLWEPERDVWELMQDFVWGYYGKAAPAMSKYYELLWTMKWPEAPKGGIRYEMTDPAFSPAFLDQATALFDEAEALAENQEVRRRIERERISLMYVKLCQGPERIGADAYRNLIFRFEGIAKREDMDYFREASQNREELIAKWREKGK